MILIDFQMPQKRYHTSTERILAGSKLGRSVYLYMPPEKALEWSIPYSKAKNTNFVVFLSQRAHFWHEGFFLAAMKKLKLRFTIFGPKGNQEGIGQYLIQKLKMLELPIKEVVIPYFLHTYFLSVTLNIHVFRLISFKLKVPMVVL